MYGHSMDEDMAYSDWGEDFERHFFSNTSYLENVNDTDLMNLLNGDFPRRSLAEQPHKLIALVVSLVSILVNVLSLMAIAKVKGFLTTNLRLIISLCISDILVSTCVLLGNFDFVPLSNYNYETCLFVSRRSLRMTSHIISLLNLLGLTFDHYFAIVRPLNHLSSMCARKTNMMICLFWLLAGIIGFSDFFIPFFQFGYCKSLNDTMTFCESVWCTAYDSEYLVIILAFILLIVMSCIYIRIYTQIRRFHSFEGRHQRFAQRTQRGLYTTLIIVGVFMICWLPYCIFEIVITFQMLSPFPGTMQYFALIMKLDFYLYDLLLMNCLIDPIIYALRMREVRRGYNQWLQFFFNKRQKTRMIVKFSVHRNSSSPCNENIAKANLDTVPITSSLIRHRVQINNTGNSHDQLIRFSSKQRYGRETTL